ncbi:MAG: hypothetical protein CSB44_01140 [Gammaproteobacteria bacterium]|nr:MAG: hypothetical protein CSB44_01140 [Gammaproteobacteria bacterium]
MTTTNVPLNLNRVIPMAGISLGTCVYVLVTFGERRGLCERSGKLEEARQYCEQARDLFAELGSPKAVEVQGWINQMEARTSI